MAHYVSRSAGSASETMALEPLSHAYDKLAARGAEFSEKSTNVPRTSLTECRGDGNTTVVMYSHFLLADGSVAPIGGGQGCGRRRWDELGGHVARARFVAVGIGITLVS